MLFLSHKNSMLEGCANCGSIGVVCVNRDLTAFCRVAEADGIISYQVATKTAWYSVHCSLLGIQSPRPEDTVLHHLPRKAVKSTSKKSLKSFFSALAFYLGFVFAGSPQIMHKGISPQMMSLLGVQKLLVYLFIFEFLFYGTWVCWAWS